MQRSGCEEDLEMTVKRLYLSDDEGFKREGVTDERKSRRYSGESGNFYQFSLPWGKWSVGERRNNSFTNSGAARGPAASESPGSLLEMQDLRSYP